MKTFSELINPKDTAILVIDVQNAFCSKGEILPKSQKYDTRPIDDMIPKLDQFIQKAREKHIQIIWIRRIETFKDSPENLKNKMKQENWADNISVPGKSSFEYYKLRPEKGEKEFTKKIYDAFTNPQLNKFLKKKKIKNLILTGVYTSRCVDSTMRSAPNLGYNILIPEDLVAMPAQFKMQHKSTLDVCKDIFGYVLMANKIIEE